MYFAVIRSLKCNANACVKLEDIKKMLRRTVKHMCIFKVVVIFALQKGG